jgi:hypothetical protein
MPVRRTPGPWACREPQGSGSGKVIALPVRGQRQALSYLAIAEAFAEAADRGDSTRLMEALLERRHEIGLPAARQALGCLVGLACLELGETPRSMLELEFVHAPSDDWWRANLGAQS